MNIIEETPEPLPLKPLVELAGEHARHILVDEGDPLMPLWLFLDGKGNLFLMGTPWRDDEEKQMAEGVVRAFVRKHGIVAYGFVVEAWTATKPKGWTPESDPHYVRPAEDPARREVVMAIATDGKRQEFRLWATRRNAEGRVSRLEEEKHEGDFGDLFGWMTELFK